MNTYTPDRWAVLEIITSEGTLKKIFSGNYGGYLGSDTWKLSSCIITEKENDSFYTFECESGSTYICYKNSYGASGYMAGIYQTWIESIEKQTDETKIQIRILNEYNKST